MPKFTMRAGGHEPDVHVPAGVPLSNKEITTAIPMFSRPRNTDRVVKIFSDF